MKFGIAARLSWVLALCCSVIAGLTGLYAYRTSHDLLTQSAKNELQASANLISRRITNLRQETSRDLQLLARHPASLAVLQQATPAQMDQLATLFSLLMDAQPGYFQIRLISASEYGLERVRVDRDEHKLVRVAADDLQEKSHFSYVSDTLKLPAGSTYLSRIVINHERGAHAGLNQPTAQLATPVMDAQGKALGIIVIAYDLKAAFATLASDLPPGFQLYLANKDGDFLIHPDPSQTFGFDRGQRVLLQDEFPDARGLVEGKSNEITLEARQAQHADHPILAAFISGRVEIPNDESVLILGLAQPLGEVLARADRLGMTVLTIVGGFGLLGILLALLLARRITRPINSMSAAVQRFSNNQTIGNMPVERQDELGQLARSFVDMQNQITLQISQLQRNSQELEHLARHDALTGLPNRRLFMERLDAALERAKRGNVTLALLFIDLDKFKDINDQLGHDAGDAALQGVATRLLANTRKVDTVARMGGDEFVVLLDNPSNRAQVLAIAQKLCQGMRAPMPYLQHELTVGLSIGISMFPQDGNTADQLMTNADRAMYRVKTHSRNDFKFASEP